MARRKLALRAALRALRSRRWRRDALCGVVFGVTAGVKRTVGDGRGEASTMWMPPKGEGSRREGRWRFLTLLVLAVVMAGSQAFMAQAGFDSEVAFESRHRISWVEPPRVEGADPFADHSLLRKRVP